MELVQRLASSPEMAAAALREAERHELIQTIADRVRFAHPLLGSTLYTDAGRDRRRSVHLRLA
jgi:hypothetical protein